jgi:hypothetical protein
VKLNHRKVAPWTFGVLALLGLGLCVKFAAPDQLLASVLAVLGTAGGVAGFLYSDGREQTRLFKELFTEFNARYDKRNDDLEAVRRRGPDRSLTDADEALCIDYFNLCAEEFLFWRAGNIPSEVWRAWCRGMLYYLSDAEILHLFERELLGDSYYGLNMAIIQDGASRG